MSRNLNPYQIAALVEKEYSDVDTDNSLDDPDFLSLSDNDSSSEETNLKKNQITIQSLDWILLLPFNHKLPIKFNQQL